MFRHFHIEQLNSIKKAFNEIIGELSPFSESTSWRYQTHDEMRTFVLTLLLFVFGIAQGQQLELKGTSYGAVTSAMYKEAKLKVAVTPQEFHELTLAYPELKIFFANRMDYQDCMLGYGSVVRWELTEEEKRNLRNFVKRNGGKMPKYRPLKSVSPSPISPAPEAEAKTTEVEKVEQEKVVLLETIESATPPINTPVRQIETEEELPQPLNKRSSREVLVTPPMKYEAGRLTMNGEGLPFREAKALSRVSDSDAFRHLQEDAAGTRLVASSVPETVIAASCSKNFGIYRERTGLLMVVSQDTNAKGLNQSTLAFLNRQNFSFPPDHGARLVTMVLSDPALRADWAAELEEVRLGMLDLRTQLASELQRLSGSDRFGFLAEHRGMFSRLGASAEHVEKLRADHAVYMVGDSRMNIAGLNSATVPLLAQAIIDAGI